MVRWADHPKVQHGLNPEPRNVIRLTAFCWQAIPAAFGRTRKDSRWDPPSGVMNRDQRVMENSVVAGEEPHKRNGRKYGS